MSRKIMLLAITTAANYCLAAISPGAIVVEQWAVRQARYHSQEEVHGLAVDSADNVYVGAQLYRPTTSEDFEALKYDHNGALVWRSFFAGYSNSDDWLGEMKGDAAGNLYLCGSAWRGGPYSLDYVTLKVNPQGQVLWTAWWDMGTPYYFQGARALDLDAQDNVYVTGAAEGLSAGDDIVTIKYNSAGVEQWVSRYTGATQQTDQGIDVVVDCEGSVYVAGCGDLGLVRRMVTIKYDAAGVQQWAAVSSLAGTTPIGLGVDALGNVDVCGTATNTICVIQYASNGMEQWVARYSEPNTYMIEANAMTLDAEGSVIVTGVCYQPYQESIFTVKYSSNGALLWASMDQGPVKDFNRGYGLATDAEGGVYVTGATRGPQWFGECLTLKFDAQGHREWAARHLCDTLGLGGGSMGTRVAVTERGSVVVAGSICMGGGCEDQDLHTIKYQQIPGDVVVGMVPTASPIQIPAGGGQFTYHLMKINHVMDSLNLDLWWQIRFPSPPGRTALLGQITAVLPWGSTADFRTQEVPADLGAGTYLYIVNVGVYPGIVWASDTLIVTKLPAGRSQTAFDPSGLNLCVSPNPFNPSTVASYKLPIASHVCLKVYDTAGRLVATLVEGWKDAGEHQVTFDGSKLASGAYLTRMETGKYSAVLKMMLIK
jgi:hypothetical protein